MVLAQYANNVSEGDGILVKFLMSMVVMATILVYPLPVEAKDTLIKQAEFDMNPASNFQIHYKSGLAGFCRKPDPANFSAPSQENCNVLAGSRFKLPTGTHEIQGEIIEINAGTVTLYTSGINFQFRLAAQAKFYCNGYSACWQALRPVTSNAFFESRTIINERNEVIFIEGFYIGEECIIDGWQKIDGALYLRLLSVEREQEEEKEKDQEQGKIRWTCVSGSALFPKEDWLIVGQLIFVLYDRENKIRRVYLPD
ncbi:MAG TPA: hypothetical protein DDW65_06620 [Firmicutes bacterium]|jgi:hypothetical protein|nr:hypothetical protein [Bacillota bacterium]